MKFKNYSDYYFLRCNSLNKYREELNNGEKLYMNHCRYFHEKKDEFQQDIEGQVYKQNPGTVGYLLEADKSIAVEKIIEQVRKKEFDDIKVICETTDVEIQIEGYLFCLTIIPKKYICFQDNKIIFNKQFNISKDFWNLLYQYSKEDGYAYCSLYDAETYIDIFCEEMTQRGYSVNYDEVSYEMLDEEKRIRYAQNDLRKIIFTKDLKFEYQNEFRFFVQKSKHNTFEHIEERGIDFKPSLVRDFVYLTPEYVNKLGWNNSEI